MPSVLRRLASTYTLQKWVARTFGRLAFLIPACNEAAERALLLANQTCTSPGWLKRAPGIALRQHGLAGLDGV